MAWIGVLLLMALGHLGWAIMLALLLIIFED